MSKEIKHRDIQEVWSGIYSEVYGARKDILGKVLTIIDAVIVDSKQNKNVKDLVKSAVWNDNYLEFRLADWLLWLDNQSEDNDNSVPWKYQMENPTPSLENYIRK